MNSPLAARLMAAASGHDGPPLTASALIAADEARHGAAPTDSQPSPDSPTAPIGPVGPAI
ncbi:hypothetical protein [Streptomyces canus]|uniref:hypothetical protein n=1 Tax=Streptomyces canus TaxID=58343 RepID=UPI0033BC21F8